MRKCWLVDGLVFIGLMGEGWRGERSQFVEVLVDDEGYGVEWICWLFRKK